MDKLLNSGRAQLKTVADFIHSEITNAYKDVYAAATEDFEKDNIGEALFFWSFLKELKLKVHSKFFEDFQYHDGFQIVDQYGRLTYFSLNIAKLLKFDLDHVLNTPFDELFERDPFMTKRIMESFVKIMSSPRDQVFDLADIPQHVVKQIGFPNDSYTVCFKKAYPVYQHDGILYGYVLRLDVNPLDH